MGVYEGRGQLAKAIKSLMQQWAETRSSWSDERPGNSKRSTC